MKRSKKEWYRLYCLAQHLWSLTIQHDGDEGKIFEALTRISEVGDFTMPNRAPTIEHMRGVIGEDSIVYKV